MQRLVPALLALAVLSVSACAPASANGVSPTDSEAAPPTVSGEPQGESIPPAPTKQEPRPKHLNVLIEEAVERLVRQEFRERDRPTLTAAVETMPAQDRLESVQLLMDVFQQAAHTDLAQSINRKLLVVGQVCAAQRSARAQVATAWVKISAAVSTTGVEILLKHLRELNLATSPVALSRIGNFITHVPAQSNNTFLAKLEGFQGARALVAGITAQDWADEGPACGEAWNLIETYGVENGSRWLSLIHKADPGKWIALTQRLCRLEKVTQNPDARLLESVPGESLAEFIDVLMSFDDKQIPAIAEVLAQHGSRLPSLLYQGQRILISCPSDEPKAVFAALANIEYEATQGVAGIFEDLAPLKANDLPLVIETLAGWQGPQGHDLKADLMRLGALECGLDDALLLLAGMRTDQQSDLVSNVGNLLATSPPDRELHCSLMHGLSTAPAEQRLNLVGVLAKFWQQISPSSLDLTGMRSLLRFIEAKGVAGIFDTWDVFASVGTKPPIPSLRDFVTVVEMEPLRRQRVREAMLACDQSGLAPGVEVPTALVEWPKDQWSLLLDAKKSLQVQSESHDGWNSFFSAVASLERSEARSILAKVASVGEGANTAALVKAIFAFAQLDEEKRIEVVQYMSGPLATVGPPHRLDIAVLLACAPQESLKSVVESALQASVDLNAQQWLRNLVLLFSQGNSDFKAALLETGSWLKNQGVVGWYGVRSLAAWAKVEASDAAALRAQLQGIAPSLLGEVERFELVRAAAHLPFARTRHLLLECRQGRQACSAALLNEANEFGFPDSRDDSLTREAQLASLAFVGYSKATLQEILDALTTGAAVETKNLGNVCGWGSVERGEAAIKGLSEDSASARLLMGAWQFVTRMEGTDPSTHTQGARERLATALALSVEMDGAVVHGSAFQHRVVEAISTLRVIQ